jgi:hypothetical protein
VIDPHIALNALLFSVAAGLLCGLGWAFADQVAKAILALMEPVYGKIVRKVYGPEGMRVLCICGLLVAVVVAILSLLSLVYSP